MFYITINSVADRHKIVIPAQT